MTVLDRLRDIRDGEPLTGSEIFDAMFEASRSMVETEREGGLALEIAIRLLEARRLGKVPKECLAAVEYLAEECGLYPYVDASHFSHLTQAVIEAHAVDLGSRRYLHSKQMQTFLWLLAGENVILSAPTSFGKSLLVDAFISAKRPQVVVMLLPTIALIDEARRRISSTFAREYDVIVGATDPYEQDRPTIFILTQERFLQRAEDIAIDLLFIDEFYKLDPDRSDGRFETLNLALWRALPRARQCFMAGPHIRAIDLGPDWTGNFRFVQTDYRTVTVNVVDRSGAERLDTFLKDLRSVGDESSLVFTAAPGSAQTLVAQIIEAGITYRTDLGSKLGSWIAENYHPEWKVADGTSAGIALHHGRVPRSLAQLFVQLFDKGELKLLVCTSTLIEGVNTAAANVFIYDKKINRSDFDFFSFSNIQGRVGRMMRHFVGNAFLYHQPPSDTGTTVSVPILADPSASTDFLVMNVERENLSPSGRLRQDRLPDQVGLSPDILRTHGNIGIHLLMEIRQKVEILLDVDPASLRWKGYPEKEQRIALAELALHVAHARHDQTGIHSAKQVAWAWWQLKASKTLGGFLRWFARTFERKEASDSVEAAFQFMQACEFAFPRTISAVAAIVNDCDGRSSADYDAYLTDMESWFRPPWMKQLDEAGIPIPLAERIARHVGSARSRKEAMAAIGRLDLEAFPDLDEIDRVILRKAME